MPEDNLVPLTDAGANSSEGTSLPQGQAGSQVQLPQQTPLASAVEVQKNESEPDQVVAVSAPAQEVKESLVNSSQQPTEEANASIVQPSVPSQSMNQAEAQTNVPESVSVLQQDEKVKQDPASLSEDEKKEKMREYQDMLKSLYKQSDYKQMKALLEEMKAYDPDEKLIEKWESKSQQLESSASKKENKEKIKDLSASIKQAFKSENFDEVAQLAEQLNTLDPGNKLSRKYLKKMGKEGDISQVNKPGLLMRLSSLFRSKNQEDDNSSESGSVESSAVQNSESPENPVKQGNLFTNLFSKNPQKTEKSIIETIVKEKDAQEKEKNDQKKSSLFSGVKSEVPKKPVFLWLKFSRLFFNLSISFVVLSGGFLYFQTVDQNNVLGVFGFSNQAAQVAQVQNQLDELKSQEEELKEQNALYSSGYSNPDQAMVDEIINSRIKWHEVRRKVEEAFERVYELNKFFGYIKANVYSLSGQEGRISISGNLSDPFGENLGKLVELEKFLKCHPACESGTNKQSQPYFTDVTPLNTFSKSFDGERWNSSFRFSFLLNDAASLEK